MRQRVLAGQRAFAVAASEGEREPALVVASASKPSPARMRALPTSQGLGMTKVPGRSCNARKILALSDWLGAIGSSSRERLRHRIRE